jgi:hypothetical protein
VRSVTFIAQRSVIEEIEELGREIKEMDSIPQVGATGFPTKY